MSDKLDEIAERFVLREMLEPLQIPASRAQLWIAAVRAALQQASDLVRGLKAQVEELTRERDASVASEVRQHKRAERSEAEVARLTLERQALLVLWQDGPSLPDCHACAVVGAALRGEGS